MAITKLDYLHVEGSKLMTHSGNQVLLRGVNVGGWLIQEAWMCPIDRGDKGWGTWDTHQAFLKQGFTKEQILQLFQVYENHWITAADLDIIQKLGMNCVRVPFWYGNFQEDDEGNYYYPEDLDQNPGFIRLDWIISECGQRGIYVILDLHGAPGFQSDDHSCGKSHSSKLFLASEEGSYYRKLTIELWQRIAGRYKGNPVVAAYDLLNEPMNGFSKEKKEDQVLWDFYDELYHAIRKIDPDHILSVEGIWEIYNLPDPALYGWKNVLYQTHNYNWKTVEVDQKIADIKERANWQVPIYVGEFQSHEIWDYTLDSYNRNQISWTTWTYKGVKSELEGWFIYKNLKVPLIDPEKDSYEVILDKWSKIATTDQFIEDELMVTALKSYSTAEID